jgi:mannosyltransferase
MIEHNKTYGFTIAVKELRETVPNIFRYASAYKRLNNLTSQGLWEMFVEPQPEKEAGAEDKPEDPNRLPDIDPEAMEGEKYNMCHFWSNFEIARLDFFRSKAYNDFFQMMDRSGGFWMERVRPPFHFLPLFRNEYPLCSPTILSIPEMILTT